ncbi:DUF962 domain-containing protein [Thalassotalea euphylliae]|uniref:Mpo1 family 2-hydroxy fatty acid dioxygenase n=1 Tax=Thalassotalea euphylliae TaxID=1655234 RepID=UPI0036407E09
MKNIIEQLSNYKSVHLNHSNIKTHFVGIPLIIWSVALLLNLIQFEFVLDDGAIHIGLASIIGVAILGYYVALHRPLALMIALLFGPLIYSTTFFVDMQYAWALAVGAFVVGWVFQFIGHAYEKAKPAFVDDLNQLLIGPLFLIAEIYFSLGFDKKMEKTVFEKAVEKRKLFEQAKRA